MDDDGNQGVVTRLARIFTVDRSILPADGGSEFNRLIFATSPYLLQHADNPVAWYEWSEDAFARAKAEDRPIFLSIGYATCHWCHVMAHESFEDQEVAAVLNRDFVAIKVDREERPDIDDTYMRVAQLMNGSGGWPLTVCMTPDREPFFVATYIPRHPRGGMLGLTELLRRITEVWNTCREVLLQNCTAILDSLRSLPVSPHGEIAYDNLLHDARRQLAGMFDPIRAGFGYAPKFPMPLYLSFLLRYGQRFGDAKAIAMVEASLLAMRRGGIFDQLGFGIHRYSVDSRWLVPHFEKMLYDQALLAAAAVESFQATGREFFREMAVEVCDFVLRELSAPEGGFYAALDADSGGGEGRFYLWNPAGIRSGLEEEEVELFCRLFGVTEGGDFEGASILNLPVSLDDFAQREGMDPALLRVQVERWRLLLLAERERRDRPFRDEKIVTAWNGLMIAALARLSLAGGGERFLVAAETAILRICRDLRRPDGRLLRSIHLGSGEIPAFLEDYAAFLHGLLALYEATLEKNYLGEGCAVAQEMLRLFAGDGGGLYDTGNDAEIVLVRGRELFDGVMPSGNALAATGLIRLGRITGDGGFIKAGEGIVRASMAGVGRQPVAHLQTLTVLDLLQGPEIEVTLAGGESAKVRAMLAVIGERFIPGLVLKRDLAEMAAVSAHVCAAGACRLPAYSPDALRGTLDQVLDECYGPRTFITVQEE